MKIKDLNSIINNIDASPGLPVTVNVKYGEDNTHELVEIDSFRQYSDMFVLNVSAMGGMLRKMRSDLLKDRGNLPDEHTAVPQVRNPPNEMTTKQWRCRNLWQQDTTWRICSLS